MELFGLNQFSCFLPDSPGSGLRKSPDCGNLPTDWRNPESGSGIKTARGSLPEREWDHAKGHKQVKGASKKMRFDVWVILFFHFSLISGSTFCVVCSAVC